jgi:hypothetical protein
MTQASDTGPAAAEMQTTLRLQHADRLPSWLWLWAPLAFAVALSLISQFQPNFYQAYFAGELGVVESLQVVVLLAALAFCVGILRIAEVRQDRLVLAWVILALFGCIYVVGEEASWGQHYFGWFTPESWQAINDQGETNLHNTSSWLDQKPRALLEMGVIVGGIVVPLVALWRPTIREGRFALFLPPLACLPVAVIAEFARTWERLVSLGLWEVRTFYRASEVQELYFYLFIFLYLMVFRQRVLARRTAGLPARPAAGY